MDPAITKQDIEILLEAVDAWVEKGSAGKLMGSMLGAMFCRTDEQREEWKKQEEESNRKQEAEKQHRKERAVVLQAKLIAMRDACVAGEFVDSASKH